MDEEKNSEKKGLTGEKVAVKDPVTEVIGEFGRWQALVCIPNILSSAIYLQQTLLTKFLTVKTDFWCSDERFSHLNTTSGADFDICLETQGRCQNWTYDEDVFQVCHVIL